MKAILLVAGLLGICNVLSADHASETFQQLRSENYFRNPLEFPEPGIEIIVPSTGTAENDAMAIQMRITPEQRTEIMRGESGLLVRRPDGDEPNGNGMWMLLLATLASLLTGVWFSMVRAGAVKRPPHRRVRVRVRRLATY